MALSKGIINPRRCSSLPLPPTMSEVGIVLLGADIPLTSQVGNFLLSRSAFETKVPLASEKLQHERARGHVEGRTITVVNTTHLYNPKLSQEELTQRVKECISLADPGPYVFLLVLQSKPISVEVQDRVRNTFENYSPLFRERSIMLITGEDHEFINEWDGRHNRLGNVSKFDQQELLQLLRKIDAVLKETQGSDLQEKKHPGKCSRNQEHSTENRAKADKDTVRKKLEKNKVSENNLRIILLGKSFLDTNIVGNLILGRSAFDPPHSVGLQCEAVGGYVNGRYITIINAPYLFGCTLTYHQLTLRIKKCVSLAAPGPHVIMLVVQPESLTEKDITRVDNILSTLSEESHKYTMVLTTKNIESVAQDKKDIVQKIIAKANSNHLDFSTCSQTDLVEKMEEMVRENKGSLICEMYEDAKPAIWQQIAYQRLRQETGTMRAERIMLEAEFRNYKERAQYIKKHYSESKQIPHLKVVQLGTGRVKDSSSKKTLESSSVCVEQKEVVRGHLITHLMMPALHSPQLSEQEVMHQIFHFVSASDSGVHAFFINVPEGPPTDETKAEIKMFQRIFGSRVNDHTIFIIQQQSSNTELDKALQSMINACGGRYHFCRSKISLQTNFFYIKNLLKENNNRQYTMAMFAEAQLEEHLKYKHELKTLQRQMTELKRNRSQTHDLSNNHEALRIVLLGKTGVGKSATGNTIMGKQVFKEILSAHSVSTVCQKEWVEIRGRKIAVIDTPGLFDTKTDNEEIRKEIVKCISMAAPGPHVFLLVLRLDRFTEEERNAVEIIENTFGKTSNQYTIILFTRGDDLYSQTIEEFLKTSGTALNTLLFSCGNRYHVFNNRDKSSNTQVLKLLDIIDTMVKVNGGSCYTNEMFQEVEEKLEKEKERILKEREEQIERERKELETKHEAEMEKMQKQKERQEAERREKEIKREMAVMEEKLREDCRKRIEDDLKTAICMEVINREREKDRKLWEKQREEDQKRRDQEEQERRRRREDIWTSQQIEENQKFEREKEEMRKSKEKELEKLQMEYELRASEEDKRMKDLKEKINKAEESKKKELQDLMLSQQREKEQRMKSEEEKTKQQQKNWEEKLAAMEEQWRSEQLRKEEEYERKLQKENEERDLKEKKRKQEEEEERQRIETDYTDKIKRMEEQLKENERIKKDEHKKELEEKIQKQNKELKKEKEENERKHNDEMEKNRAFFQEQHEKALKKLKEETEQEARKQAEKEFCGILAKKH